MEKEPTKRELREARRIAQQEKIQKQFTQRRLKRKLWVREGDILLIEPWELSGDEKGDIIFKMTDGSEKYTPLGENKPVEVSAGEYACMDEEKILCRMDIKQCDETKITKETKEFIIYVQGNKITESDYLQKTLRRVCDLIKEICGGDCSILMDGSN